MPCYATNKVRCINRNYVTGCHTATFQWHLISSFYDYLPWARCGVAVANEPWSGSYEITSPTWGWLQLYTNSM